jgi:hypothetical protein
MTVQTLQDHCGRAAEARNRRARSLSHRVLNLSWSHGGMTRLTLTRVGTTLSVSADDHLRRLHRAAPAVRRR